eukprot:MONOS_3566.1-p1 / transcript=MONOS_3566.1 / gene=MONOS_3566 / organism=Monocercomonoides_exilis_PA203 / gene_product=unspecified product / transcript_product=unspecified product / location=Mono_scaffold00085:1968-4330(-) / protein_length=719 / sequence_SO=supercontig / SO=protein_coding / is_pseudo=false
MHHVIQKNIHNIYDASKTFEGFQYWLGECKVPAHYLAEQLLDYYISTKMEKSSRTKTRSTKMYLIRNPSEILEPSLYQYVKKYLTENVLEGNDTEAFKAAMGKVHEEYLSSCINELGIPFITEEGCKTDRLSKTPDILLTVPFIVDTSLFHNEILFNPLAIESILVRQQEINESKEVLTPFALPFDPILRRVEKVLKIEADRKKKLHRSDECLNVRDEPSKEISNHNIDCQSTLSDKPSLNSSISCSQEVGNGVSQSSTASLSDLQNLTNGSHEGMTPADLLQYRMMEVIENETRAINEMPVEEILHERLQMECCLLLENGWRDVLSEVMDTFAVKSKFIWAKNERDRIQKENCLLADSSSASSSCCAFSNSTLMRNEPNNSLISLYSLNPKRFADYLPLSLSNYRMLLFNELLEEHALQTTFLQNAVIERLVDLQQRCKIIDSQRTIINYSCQTEAKMNDLQLKIKQIQKASKEYSLIFDSDSLRKLFSIPIWRESSELSNSYFEIELKQLFENVNVNTQTTPSNNSVPSAITPSANPTMPNQTNVPTIENVSSSLQSSTSFSPPSQQLKCSGLSSQTTKAYRQPSNEVLIRRGMLPQRRRFFPVCWIDSKASFSADALFLSKTLQQLASYAHRFGPGMVIFWGDFIDEMNEVLCQCGLGDMILCTNTFPSKETIISINWPSIEANVKNKNDELSTPMNNSKASVDDEEDWKIPDSCL